jgi:hypothetical protein
MRPAGLLRCPEGAAEIIAALREARFMLQDEAIERATMFACRTQKAPTIPRA